MKKTSQILLLLVLVLGAVWRSWWGTQLDSFTVDEPYHMVAGISYVKTGDFRLNPEHPPLTKLWVGLLAPSDFKLRPFEPLNDKYAERNFLEETMYYDNDFERAQQAARVAMWLYNGALLWVLLLLVWHLWSFPAAVVTGLFLALEPSASAHMPLVMTDLPLALALVINALCAIQFVRQWRWGWGLALALATGLALATKFSALPGVVAIYVTAALLALWPVFKGRWLMAWRRLGQLLLMGVLSVVLLWACYGFQYHASPGGSDPFNRTLEAKIDDLSTPHWQGMLRAVDDLQLLPRAYIWGLADTVKAGVEGRGPALNFIYGKKHRGEPPWFYWPANITAKVPLPLLGLFLVAVMVLLYVTLQNQQNQSSQDQHRDNKPTWILWVMAAVYLLTLMSSAGTYAGIRHALPLLVVMAVISGLMIHCQRSKLTYGFSMAALLLTIGMTWDEQRLWEYHNETAGGTENAYKNFANEGLDLGQRVKELEHFIKANQLEQTNKFKYAWLIEEELKARGIEFTEVMKGIDDDNYAGIYEGYFFMRISDLLPWDGWDPKQLEMLDYVDRIGFIYIMKGRYVDPLEWARLMRHEVRKYVAVNENPDWQKVADRLERVTAQIDFHFDTFIYLGNAYVKTQQREAAIKAYEKAYELIDQSKAYRHKITAQIKRLQANTPWADLGILRPDYIE